MKLMLCFTAAPTHLRDRRGMIHRSNRVALERHHFEILRLHSLLERLRHRQREQVIARQDRNAPLTDVEIETPLIRMSTPRIAGKKLVFAPILRAGMTFVEGMLDLVPTARVAHIGLSGNLLGVFRDRIETVEAVVQDAALCRAAT
jgi:hypothetical protein